MATPLRLSIIVPFHKNLAQLSQCLTAIRRACTALPRDVEVADLIVAADGAVDDPGGPASDAGATVLTLQGPHGPAWARNRAAAIASGDVLIFADTDVVMATPSLTQFAARFAADPALGAVFGAYDDAPADPGFLSQCRNLAHSFVHHRAKREARTFWAGLGAVKKTVFDAVGGFDERFVRPSVEDIDLGYRIDAAGFRIALDPSIQGKHLKRWTLRSALTADVRDRGVPWTQLIRRYGIHNDLNVTVAYRVCVVLSYLLVACLIGAWWEPRLLIVAAAILSGLWMLDASYYRFFVRQRGLIFALRWFPFHILHHLSNGVSFAVGTTLAILRARTGLALPGALPTTRWAEAQRPVTTSSRSRSQA